jgi:hypothetical protein
MIRRNEKFHWQQLNGPQNSGMEEAIKQYHIDAYDEHLEYFRKFSIEESNNAHLSFIGRLMRFPRPIVLEEERWNLYFKFYNYSGTGIDPEPPLPKNDDGFSDPADPLGRGGIFRPDSADTSDYTELDDIVYRRILRRLADTESSVRGLDIIDYLAYNLLVKNGVHIPYRIDYLGKDGNHNKFQDIMVTAAQDCGYNMAVFIVLMDRIFDTIPIVTLRVGTV